jgi:phosphoribosylanthranilate isomerase
VSGWVKICGLTQEAAVATAVDCGVDAVGFVCYPGSVRHLAPDAIARLAGQVPPTIQRVVVTRRPSQSLIDELVACVSFDVLQMDQTDFDRLIVPAGLRRLPVLRHGVAWPRPLPDWCLYEGPESGRGLVADWDEAADLAGRTALVLAGGLQPANVDLAIRAVRPMGVDVSSGVERAPGTKDAELMRAFVVAARAAWTEAGY